MDELTMDALQTAGVAVGGAFVGHGLIKLAPEKFRKFAGPVGMVAGVACQFVDNSYVNDAGIGLLTVGAFDTVSQWTPDTLKASKIGKFIPSLNGLEGDEMGYIDYEDYEGDEDFDYELDSLNGFTDDFEALDTASNAESLALALEQAA